MEEVFLLDATQSGERWVIPKRRLLEDFGNEFPHLQNAESNADGTVANAD
jgi:hypothetical protein